MSDEGGKRRTKTTPPPRPDPVSLDQPGTLRAPYNPNPLFVYFFGGGGLKILKKIKLFGRKCLDYVHLSEGECLKFGIYG